MPLLDKLVGFYNIDVILYMRVVTTYTTSLGHYIYHQLKIQQLYALPIM